MNKKNLEAAEILEREKRGKTISQRMMIQASNSFAASVVDHFRSIFSLITAVLYGK